MLRILVRHLVHESHGFAGVAMMWEHAMARIKEMACDAFPDVVVVVVAGCETCELSRLRGFVGDVDGDAACTELFVFDYYDYYRYYYLY